MRNFKTILMVAAAVTTLAACNYGDQDMGYLGDRNDIIVSNNGVKEAVKMEAKAEMASAKAEGMKVASDTMEAEMKTAVVTERVSTTTTDTTNSTITPAAGAPMPSGAQGDIPPNARPGECYAKVLIPAVSETATQRIQVAEEQKVLNRIIPAKYETTTERIKIKEARQYWKAGHGPITKKNEVTGEILCLVEEPAEYKTIEKRVLVTPEQPEYKTVPAQFETVTQKKIIQAESWEWRRILCETNLGQSAIMQIQRGLQSKGYNVTADGRLGTETLNAINSYQLKNGLASRGITYETLNHMGVSLTGA